MVPCMISNARFEGNAAIDRYVEQIHNGFEGCYNNDGCGKVTFIGNILASTEVVTREQAVEASAGWADFIRSLNEHNKKIWAIAITLVKKNEIERYKETIYVNTNYDHVKFYTSPWDRYGTISRSQDSYGSIEHFLGPVFEALEIKYK